MPIIRKLHSLSTQVGGNHYKEVEYELAQFALDIGLNSMLHSAIKYVIRTKNDRRQDLEKAIHCCSIFADWAVNTIKEDSKAVLRWNTQFDFNLVSAFVNQFKPSQQAALIAILTLQSDLTITSEIDSDWETVCHLNLDLIESNYKKVLNAIGVLQNETRT